MCVRETLGAAESLLKSSAEVTLSFTAKSHFSGEASCAVKRLTGQKYGAPFWWP